MAYHLRENRPVAGPDPRPTAEQLTVPAAALLNRWHRSVPMVAARSDHQ
jgi:hypothetical protein